MLNYAQKALRLITQKLDENYQKQDAWAGISDHRQGIQLTLTSGSHSFTVLLTGEVLGQALALTDNVLTDEADSLRGQEVGMCQEVVLLHKHYQASDESRRTQRKQAQGNGN